MDIALLDRIYLERATYLLEDHCQRLNLDFGKFNDFLIKYGGIVCGSMALSCFDNTFTPGDMDIFIFTDARYRYTYQQLLLCFNDGGASIKVDKIPLHNIFSFHNKTTSEYMWKFIHESSKTKLIDMVIFTMTLNDFLQRSMFICNEFYWNGLEWHTPPVSLTKFLTYKVVDIKRSTSIDFLLVYEPWLFPEDMSSINSIFCYQIKEKVQKLKILSPKKFRRLDPEEDINIFFGEKKIASFDIYLLIKTLYRIYKYKNRGYQFPTLNLFMKQAYNNCLPYEHYDEQIEKNKLITLPSGHEMKICTRNNMSITHAPPWEQENDGW